MSRDCPRAHPDLTVLELLFDSEAMLLIGRLAIVSAAVVMLVCGLFVLGSIAVRIRRGHWLRRAGPFEVSDTRVGEVDQVTEALREVIGEQLGRITALEALLGVWAKGPVDDNGDS